MYDECEPVHLLCMSGWTDSRGLDGGYSEIHGQSLSTHLVRALWSQRPAPSGQTVVLQRLLHFLIELQGWQKCFKFHF